MNSNTTDFTSELLLGLASLLSCACARRVGSHLPLASASEARLGTLMATDFVSGLANERARASEP